MDIQLPVYLFDVVTASATPRTVVTCRAADSAQDLAARLNAMTQAGALDGDESFVAAAPRVAVITMAVDPGSTVMVKGYAIASDVLAAQLAPAPTGSTTP